MSKPPITDLALAEGLYRMRLERIPVQASVNEALKKLLYQFKANRYTHSLLREVIEGVDKWIVMYSKSTALLFTIYPSLRWEYKPFTTYDKLQLEVDNLYVTNQWPGSIRKKLDEKVTSRFTDGWRHRYPNSKINNVFWPGEIYPPGASGLPAHPTLATRDRKQPGFPATPAMANLLDLQKKISFKSPAEAALYTPGNMAILNSKAMDADKGSGWERTDLSKSSESSGNLLLWAIVVMVVIWLNQNK